VGISDRTGWFKHLTCYLIPYYLYAIGLSGLAYLAAMFLSRWHHEIHPLLHPGNTADGISRTV
jgi:hypothetical protein